MLLPSFLFENLEMVEISKFPEVNSISHALESWLPAATLVADGTSRT